MSRSAGMAGGTLPVPLRLTCWGLPPALSVTCRLAAAAPTATGGNGAVGAQLGAGASVGGGSGQEVVRAKSPALAPLSPTLEMVSGALPVLVSVTLCAALVVPIRTVP